MEHRKDLEDIIKKYGRHNQQMKAIEEMAELTQAICKQKTNNDPKQYLPNNEQIIEELADAKIMIDQLMIIYGEDMVMEVVKEKIQRQKVRMLNE